MNYYKFEDDHEYIHEYEYVWSHTPQLLLLRHDDGNADQEPEARFDVEDGEEMVESEAW